MFTPDLFESRFTLLGAAARYDALRARETLATTADEFDSAIAPSGVPLTKEETLELLTLGEVLARKAAYGRQLSVRAARESGASWSQIGAALGTSKQAAWEAHSRWIDSQAAQYGEDEDYVAAARRLAGEPE